MLHTKQCLENKLNQLITVKIQIMKNFNKIFRMAITRLEDITLVVYQLYNNHLIVTCYKSINKYLFICYYTFTTDKKLCIWMKLYYIFSTMNFFIILKTSNTNKCTLYFMRILQWYLLCKYLEFSKALIITVHEWPIPYSYNVETIDLL